MTVRAGRYYNTVGFVGDGKKSGSDRMNTAKWIWYPGDYELYHNIKLHSRRQKFDSTIPMHWTLYSPYPLCEFFKTITAEHEFTLKIVSDAAGSGVLDNVFFPLNKEITVPAGKHDFRVLLLDGSTFPSFYVDSEYLISDESWQVRHGTPGLVQAAGTPAYLSENDRPTKFPFSYTPIQPVSVEKTDGGWLYDFGKELFGRLQIRGADPDEIMPVYYGESREEATDREFAMIREKVCGSAEYDLAARGYRYVFIDAPAADKCEIWTEYEYLPLEDVGSFSCDDPMVGKIYDTCAYTFHLNSREFYLDGIKRDRWVWSGDAYQSYKINNYLYFDPEITKRTIIAMIGKPPYEVHINTINDYTLYHIIAVYEYYYSTGDMDFVRFIYPRVKALYEFVLSRLDEDGLMVQREGDWIFIDWSDMDKSGPLCAEQILLWQAHVCMDKLAALCGDADERYLASAENLRKIVLERFWNEDKGAFIDTYTSGQNKVTRHANIFAILYDFVDTDVQLKLMETVLHNDAVTQITTPYFKFFELMALCKLGELETMQSLIDSYWGGMLRLGATTIWEQYDPNEKGAEHYAMYGDKYGKSLCHAWGSGPIYLLGRYCLGVYPTDIGYRTFTVAPNLGKYKEMQGSVPILNGRVDVEVKDGHLRVSATRPGGTLLFGGKSYDIPANEPLCLNI